MQTHPTESSNNCFAHTSPIFHLGVFWCVSSRLRRSHYRFETFASAVDRPGGRVHSQSPVRVKHSGFVVNYADNRLCMAVKSLACWMGDSCRVQSGVNKHLRAMCKTQIMHFTGDALRATPALLIC